MTARDPAALPDFERALMNPAAEFASPEAVLGHALLSDHQKIEILQRWEYDAADISVAVEEGMPGAEETLLRRITLALQQLAGPLDLDRTGPSKQHGLPRSGLRPKPE
ncbi:hypothetical protein [Neoroseomonas soli]|uniref:Uncharacterized protein n=1 Tax=Neoroseomonas soli TaxID=1081025 RepID=A0A9X9X2T8_9PROT|nr:hypothetical protein [Neoroseomonas soli]MBR0673717.1 hypothetical protein [Neoroseomonas soli]